MRVAKELCYVLTSQTKLFTKLVNFIMIVRHGDNLHRR